MNQNDATFEQQARAREDFVLGLFRLFKLATMHQLNNQAVLRGVEHAAANFGELLAREQGEVSALFAGENVFLSGQPLKASRATYESASELGKLLADIGVNEVRLRRGVSDADLIALLEHFNAARADASKRQPKVRVSEAVLLQYVDPTFLLGDGDNEDISVEQQVTRTFSSAVVVLRRLHESVGSGQYRLMRTLKRIAQSLVMLAEQDPDTLRAVTAMRGTREDSANLAVCSAVTATLSTFMLTRDIRALSRVCLAALTNGVGEHRLSHTRHDDDDPFAASGSLALTSDETARVPSSDAVSLVALAGLYPASSARLPLAFESSWLARDERLGPAYEGKIAPDVEALIIAYSYKLHRVLAYDLAAASQLTPDDAAALLTSQATSRAAKYVLQLVLCSMEIYPRGTIVELSSGWQGVVLGTPYQPGAYGRPTVRLMIDPSGRASGPLDIDLSLIHADVLRLGNITRVLHDGQPIPPALIDTRRAVDAGDAPVPNYPRPGEPVLRTSAQVDDMLSRVSDVLGSPSPAADLDDFDDLSFDEAVSLSLTGVYKDRNAEFAARADADAAARSGNTASVSFDELLSLNEAPLPEASQIEFPDLSSFPGKPPVSTSQVPVLSSPDAASAPSSISEASDASDASDDAPRKAPPAGVVTGGFGVIRRKKKRKKKTDDAPSASKPLGTQRREPGRSSTPSTPLAKRAEPSDSKVAIARVSPVPKKPTPEPAPSPEPTPAPVEPPTVAERPEVVEEPRTAASGRVELKVENPQVDSTAMLGSNAFALDQFNQGLLDDEEEDLREFGDEDSDDLPTSTPGTPEFEIPDFDELPEPAPEAEAALEEASSALVINPLRKKNHTPTSTKFSIGDYED